MPNHELNDIRRRGREQMRAAHNYRTTLEDICRRLRGHLLDAQRNSRENIPAACVRDALRDSGPVLSQPDNIAVAARRIIATMARIDDASAAGHDAERSRGLWERLHADADLLGSVLHDYDVLNGHGHGQGAARGHGPGAAHGGRDPAPGRAPAPAGMSG